MNAPSAIVLHVVAVFEGSLQNRAPDVFVMNAQRWVALPKAVEMVFVGAWRAYWHQQDALKANTTIVAADGGVFGVSEKFDDICNMLDARRVL